MRLPGYDHALLFFEPDVSVGGVARSEATSGEQSCQNW
jgi:hypothetical protein